MVFLPLFGTEGIKMSFGSGGEIMTGGRGAERTG